MISQILFFGLTYAQQQQQQEGGLGVQQGAWNGSLLDNLNNQFQLRNISLLFRSYCGQEIQRVLNNRTANLTFFAPSDSSLGQMLNMSGQMGAAEFNCSTQGTNGSQIAQYCDPNQWPISLQNVSFYNVSACSPLLLQYHVVPDQVLNITRQMLQSNSSQQQQPGGAAVGGIFRRFQRQGGAQAGQQSGESGQQNTLNVTVLQTLLNDTRFVNLPQNHSQVLILNQTNDGFYLNHGAWPPARVHVNESVNATNGIAYIIDGLLVPPMNLTRSLEMLNMTSFSQALQSQQQQQKSARSQFQQLLARQQPLGQQQSGGAAMGGQSQQQQQGENIDQMHGITVFAPLEQAISQSGGQSFNLSAHIIPGQIIYNNGTALNQSSFQALDGSSYSITVDRNYTMRIGNSTVVESNILLSNGVLHIIDTPLQANQTTGA